MTDIKTTLYWALNNTQIEHFVEHLEDQLRLWPHLLWSISVLPHSLEWKTDYRDNVSFAIAYTPEGEVAVYIYRIITGTSRYHWTIMNSDGTDLIEDMFSLDVSRYQQDRVELVIRESEDGRLKAILQRWIEKHWTNNKSAMYEELGPENAPASRVQIPETKGRGQPASPETIQKYHKLAKTTTRSANNIQNGLGTTTETYYKHCRTYTGEEPINMEERGQLIKESKWPPSG